MDAVSTKEDALVLSGLEAPEALFVAKLMTSVEHDWLALTKCLHYAGSGRSEGDSAVTVILQQPAQE